METPTIDTLLGPKTEDEVTVEPDWLDESDRFGVKYNVRLRGTTDIIAQYEGVFGRKHLNPSKPIPRPDDLVTADFGHGVVKVKASALEWSVIGEDCDLSWTVVKIGKVPATGQVVHRAPDVYIKRPQGGMQAVKGLFA